MNLIEKEINEITNIELNKTILSGIGLLLPVFPFIGFFGGGFVGAFATLYIPEIIIKSGNIMLFKYLGLIDNVIFLLSMMIGVSLGFALTIILAILENITSLIKQQVLSLYKKLKNTENYKEDIHEIQTLCDKIYKNTKNINRLLSLKFLFTKEGKEKIQQLGKLVINIMLGLLINLRSDLSIRLIEQQQTLEFAKSEVEQNIKGTTELSQVSEVQRARLNRQIEQFEELQRVLIKA